MGTEIIYERTKKGGKIGFETSDVTDMTSKIGVGTYTAISETSDYQLRVLRDKLIEDFPLEDDDKPDKFDEPYEKGFYITQSGIPFYNDKSEDFRWWCIDPDADCDTFNTWQEMIEGFDEDEFPLTRITREQIATLAKEQ